jgi:3-methyladenine DNA glycosylase AlkD
MTLAKKIKAELRALASPERAESMKRFFKTAKGEYGEGDRFHGVSVPQQRNIAKIFMESADADTIKELIQSPYHEERLTAIFLLVNKFKKEQKKGNGKVWIDLYLEYRHQVNNWDLVDSSAHLILGKWLEDKNRSILFKLAAEKSLWSNRIAIIATLHFIRNNDFKDIIHLAEKMLSHPHDLIHKATGWMLREAWQKHPTPIEAFLNKFKNNMPRTMLRYAIEKMPEKTRKAMLTK